MSYCCSNLLFSRQIAIAHCLLLCTDLFQIIYLFNNMSSRVRRNYGITHSLTPLIAPSPPKIQADDPEPPQKKYSPLYTKNNFINPHTTRSRKHRLLQEKNTDIERENQRLYEKLRKIKMKNAYEGEDKLEGIAAIPEQTLFGNNISKPLSLPHVGSNYFSPASTKSKLNSILNDRMTFVSKYFEQLAHLRTKLPKKTEELGNFICNGWKVKVLLLDEEFILLRGRKGIKQLTKKYKWAIVKKKMATGLEDWVRLKFQFQD